MRTLKIKKLSLLICLALMPLSVYAAGLGKLNVSSNLGEPFNAEVELLSTTPEELESLVAVVASEEAYAAQGITRLGIHSDIKVEVVNTGSGNPKIKLTSSQAVTDPYVDMLIQLDWASGRLQREYTVLLDPPDYKKSLKNQEVAEYKSPVNKPAPVPSVESNVTESIPDATGFPAEGVDAPDVDKEIQDLKEKVQPAIVKPTTPSQRKTKSGDSLSKIASSMRVDGVSLDQMLVALYEQNKGAFVGENMNRLKVGKVIKLPSKEILLATGRSDANKTVQMHVADWNAYRTNLASTATETRNSQPSQNNQSEAGKVESTQSATLPSQASGQDVVKLSAGEKDKLSKDAKKAEDAKKIAEQEDQVAHDKALAEAKDRTVAVEKQIEEMQKLLEMKNQAMSEMQKKAEADLSLQKSTPETKPSQEAADAEGHTNLEAPPDATVTEEAKPEVAQKEEVKPEPKPTVVPKSVEPAVDEASFIDGLLGSINLPLIAGLAGIGLLGAGWAYLRNKRRKDLESFERGILTSGGLRANTVFGNTTGSTSSSDTSFLTDFAQSTDGSMMDTNDVDPIAEAEVYMAYGRDAQAEEILKDAIVKEPKRYELHLKLLEMYVARKDTSAFEAIAGELYTTLGSDDSTWAKVAEMGRGLEPENPLYASGATAKLDDIPVATEKVIARPNQVSQDSVKMADVANVAASAASVALSAPNINGGSRIESIVKHERVEKTEAQSVSAEEQKNNFEVSLSQDDDIQMSLVSPPSTSTQDEIHEDVRIKQGFESASVEDISFDSDLELSEDGLYEVTQSDMTVADLNFDLMEGAIDEAVKTETVTETKTVDSNLKSFDLSSISLDLDGPVTELTIDSPEPESKVVLNKVSAIDPNDVEVKLNLVAAYIDMDDKEGARELLDEVMKEGTEEQIMRGQMMLDSIS